VGRITEHQKSIFEWADHEKPEHQDQLSNSKADPDESINLLHKLREQCLACQGCVLRKSCKQVVFGDGNPSARLMLIGEGPGADEDRIGIPFVGRAGQLLDRILEAAKIKRSDIYIANIVKCRPPANRLPLQPEVDACLPYLQKQITLINPEMIVCLGALAMRTLIDKNSSISRSRGQWHIREGRRIIATYHPAALLRDPGKKKDVWTDFQEIMKDYHPA
jgi:uracil-DNA glycosylase